jgi:hypothetical protein
MATENIRMDRMQIQNIRSGTTKYVRVTARAESTVSPDVVDGQAVSDGHVIPYACKYDVSPIVQQPVKKMCSCVIS